MRRRELRESPNSYSEVELNQLMRGLAQTILAQAGFVDATEPVMGVENGVVVRRKPTKAARMGWAEALTMKDLPVLACWLVA